MIAQSNDVPIGKTKFLSHIFVARILVMFAFLSIWEISARLGLVDSSFVSTPLNVGRAFLELFRSNEFYSSLYTTLIETIIAFTLSIIFGVLAAFILDRSTRTYQVLAPYITAFNSMPRIALGPLFILWFGLGMESKVALAFSLGFFIMLATTLGGLKNVDRDLLVMAKLFGASEIQLFVDIRAPWALPSIFSGLRLTIIYCGAGAVVGEMIAAQSGLGLLLQTASSRFDVATVMALVVVLAGLIMLLTGALDLVESRLLSWSEGSTDLPS